MLLNMALCLLAGICQVVSDGPDEGAPTLTRSSDGTLTVDIIPDAWPSRVRTIAYEYNQKNHHAEPEFVRKSGAGGGLSVPVAGRNRFRLIAVRVDNEGEEQRELEIRSEQIRGGKKQSLTVPPKEWVTQYYAIREPEELKLRVELFEKKVRDPIASREEELPEGGRVTGWASEVLEIAKELAWEDHVRRRLRTRPVSVTVHDDLGLPVRSRLLLLLEGGMMVYEGRTDLTGEWSGRVLPGSYEVYAFAEVPDRTDRTSSTVVEELHRLLALRGRIAADADSVSLKPSRKVLTTVNDVAEQALIPRRVWITPTPLAEAYRYSAIAGRLGSRARVDSQRAIPGGRFWLLTSKDLSLEVSALAEPADDLTLLLSSTIAGTGDTATLTFDPARDARLVLDPATGPGPGRRAEVTLVAVDGLRETMTAETRDLHTFYAPPGSYRVELGYELHDGTPVSFAPHRVEAKAGKYVDLTPRAPFDLTLYFKRKDKKLQFWLAVSDAAGRFLTRAPSGDGMLTSVSDRGQLHERPLSSLRWESPSGLEQANLEKFSFKAEIPFGDEPIVGGPKVERLRAFNVEGASGFAPAILGPRVMELLPEVKRAIDGSLRFLGLPEGLRRIHMEFDIFLPPGVGGLGGGGTIVLDAQVLFPFTSGVDPLPGAFRHELGHNLGFGHDPYMLLAPAGVDEERFGEFGYRMQHAADFQRTLRYLEGDRGEERLSWSPGAGVYDGLRLLYGPDIHKRMIQERKVSEQALNLHALSSIERIATLYSLVAGENVAWIFRAHGWPVFDGRVHLGGAAARTISKHPRQLNYGRIEGTAINAWWVIGPVRGGADSDAQWRRALWPSRFIRVDEDRPPEPHSQKYLYFREIVAPKEMQARVLVASDVQLEIRLNGSALGFLDASPQQAQPVHDELMLNQKRPFTANLFKGVNYLEVAVNQPRGSKGFLVEFITEEGKPLPLRVRDDGPPGEDLSRDIVRLGTRNPVYNGSFDGGGRTPTGWTVGAVEGPMNIAADNSRRLSGERSLRIDVNGSSRGGLIQRVVVEPGKKYRLSGSMSCENLDGEAYISLFTGDINGNLGRTDPLRARNSNWKTFSTEWFPGTSRVVYVACYAKASTGTVWFDDVELKEVR